MKHYKAKIYCDNINGTATAYEMVNTFDGAPFVWVNDGSGKVTTERTGAFPEQTTSTQGTVIHYPVGSAIDGTLHVAVDRTSDDYIEASVKDNNGDQTELLIIPVEFYVYD